MKSRERFKRKYFIGRFLSCDCFDVVFCLLLLLPFFCLFWGFCFVFVFVLLLLLLLFVCLF